MFFLAFLSAWFGSTFAVFAVIVWAALGVVFSKRSILQSAALVFIALIFGTTAVLWYIFAWWVFEILLGLLIVEKAS